jgi:Zn-dependent peptidase ImmA (M78 family)
MAQQFSGELLAPARELYKDLKAGDITPARLLELKRKWLISAAALLYRAHDLAVIRESQYRRISAQISALGWRTSEPDPLSGECPGCRAGNGAPGHQGDRQHQGRSSCRRDHTHPAPCARRTGKD